MPGPIRATALAPAPAARAAALAPTPTAVPARPRSGGARRAAAAGAPAVRLTPPGRAPQGQAPSIGPRTPVRASNAPVGGSGGPAPAIANKRAAADPRFQRTIDKLQKGAARTKTHPTAAKKASDAQGASQPPANEKLAGAQAQNVDAMKAAEAPKPEPNSFLQLLRAEIAKLMPQNLDETKTFPDDAKKAQMKGATSGNVNTQKDAAAGPTKAASDAPPDPSRVPGKEVTPLPTEPPATPPPSVDAAGAMPAPKPESEVSLQDSKKDADKQLADAEVTPTQLQKANDPRFTAVLDAKKAVEQQADSAPQKYRGDEQKTTAQEAAKAVADEKGGLAGMAGVRGKANTGVKNRQQIAKEKDEAERKKVTDTIQNIFNETRQAVDAKLATLETDVSALFDRGMEAAITNMKNYVNARLDDYKADRYGGVLGGALWIKDQFLDLPDEVNVFYEEGRKRFTQDLDTLIVQIANLVERRIKEAKAEIDKGQKRISTYVAGLPKDLQTVGRAAEREVAGRFDELRQGVDDKKNELAQKLAQRYKDATEKADAALKEIKEANRGLVSGLVDKLREIVEMLRKFKERITGMIKKGVETIKLIIADPIGFLKNLLSAVKQGISQFVANIWTHLKAGFMKWLFGTLADAGVQMPSDFSLGSILKLVLQILGLTYDRIRAKAVKLIGERNVMLLEKAWELISALITGGPSALWEKIKEFLGNLKEMVLDALQQWVVETVIKSAITKLATMFNPVGAIVQAIITIYNTVMFFIERINQILDLVEAIINSVHKIATGDISSAANWVEQALARTVPVIISFLARLIGLGGLSDKIKGIIKKIQSTVDKAVDKLIDKIVGGIKKLFGGGKDSKPDERTPAQKQQDLDKAFNEANQLLNDMDLAPEEIQQKLGAIKQKYKLTRLELVKDETTETEETDHIHAEINPSKDTGKKKRIIRMKQVPIPFSCPADLDKGEYQRQLDGQQAGLNAMKVLQWQTNRQAYLDRAAATGSGRSPEGSKAQERFRAQKRAELIADKIAELKASGMSQDKAADKATKEIDKFMKTQAALHDPDQVAGGDPTKIRELGSRRINYSIGSQWKTNVLQLDKAVAAALKAVSKKKKADLRMNVKLVLA